MKRIQRKRKQAYKDYAVFDKLFQRHKCFFKKYIRIKEEYGEKEATEYQEWFFKDW